MEYNKVTAEIAQQLKAIAPNRVFVGEEINEDYSHDEMRFYGQWVPDVVFEAVSADEISQVLKIARGEMRTAALQETELDSANLCPCMLLDPVRENCRETAQLRVTKPVCRRGFCL